MKENRWEIRLSGSGGQGLITAGIILAEAACVFDGKEAVQTQSYGPESRGGHSKSEVVISDAEIDYPKVVLPDLLVAMTQEAFDSYAGRIKPGGTIIVDSGFVERTEGAAVSVTALPLTVTAKEVTGRTIAANIVALGAIVAATGIVSRPAIESAVARRVPKGTEEMNLAALRAGYALEEGSPA